MKYFGGTVEADGIDEAREALRMRIGKNLRSLREMKGLTVEEVTREVGDITANTIRNYEAGQGGLSYENAWRLADFYGVTLATLGGRIEYERGFEGTD